MTVEGGCEKDLGHRMNEGYKASEELKSMLSNRRIGIDSEKWLHEGVIVYQLRCTE